MNRREFLSLTASAAAMLGLSGCSMIRITPSAERNPIQPRPLRADGKVRIAQIGCGGKGSSDLAEFAKGGQEIVALCDVDAARAKGVFGKYPDVPKYQDFRKMLLEKGDEIDACVVSTPDHMHFLAAWMSMAMGKHVYVQKPLTQTIGEARELLRMARLHNVCTQMGNQGHASDDLRQLKEWLMAGIIGEVKEVHVWTNRPIWPQGLKERPQAQDPPSTMAWDLWLGRAPARPYNEAYAPFKWRGFLDFGSGALGDMGCHAINGPYFALDLDYPLSVVAETSGLTEETFPDWSIIRYEFGPRGNRPGLKLTWYDGGKLPPKPPEMEASRKLNSGGQIFIGTKGVILSQGETTTSIRLVPETKMKEMMGQLPPATLPRVPDRNHYMDWIRAIQAGDRKASGTHFDYAVPLVEMVQLGNVALRVPNETVTYDGKRGVITSHRQLNKLVYPTFRKGWKPKGLNM